MTDYNGLEIGNKVMANGYEGVIVRLCEWSSSLVEVRLSSGIVCVCASDVEAI